MTADSEKWLSVIGIGDDGWDGLGPEARELIRNAAFIVGGERHLLLLPKVRGETKAWPSNFVSAVEDLAARRGTATVVLASGDPLLYGVGTLIARTFSVDEVRVIPHLSTLSLVTARLLWPQTDVTLISLCGRPVERLRPALFDGEKCVVLSADGTTPATVGTYLRAHGFGKSQLHIFEHLGRTDEAHIVTTADEIEDEKCFRDLNAIAIACVADADAVVLPSASGLLDSYFANDGQLTKREIRAVTLSRLEPRPGGLLWDIGTGAGSIAIEWLRSAPRTRAIGIEKDAERAERARANGAALGVAGYEVREGAAHDVIPELPAPDAIFIGGGLASNDILSVCWERLKPGGRVVANAVTLESEQILFDAFRTYGGDLTRVGIERADPVGRLTGWRPAMTVTQWAASKPYDTGTEPAT